MSKRLLLVEDNPIEAREISFFLQQADFEPEIAPDAEQGFQMLLSDRFDLLLCDLHLPGENGFELCRRVKRHPDLKAVPVVLLTRFSDPLNFLRGLESGADGFISKGQSAANIIQRLRRVLSWQQVAGQTSEDQGPDRVVFLETEFEFTAQRSQLLEILLSGFEDVVHLNEKYEEEVAARAVAQKSLRDANALYHSLVETLPLSVVRKDLKGRYTFVNQHFCQSLGKSQREIISRTDENLFPTTLAQKYAGQERQLFETGEVLDTIETVQDRHGENAYLRVRKVPVPDSKGEVIGIQGIYWDVTELKRSEQELRSTNATLEQRVAQRTNELKQHVQELEKKNAELDRFVYVASHDLQEPVRKLISFSQLLESDLQGQLSEAAVKDLHYITDAARRMQTLVQDLLALSRAGRSAMKREQVRLDDCVDRALEALAVRIEECRAEVIRDPLPEVQGDRTTLTQLYQNLIANALKFVSHVQPQVRVTAEKADGQWVLGVRDNGIGIELEHQTKIFAPFQRLHGRTEYEGTGIGLAICQTTVERHDGRIWVESTPGEGSHFRFTLKGSRMPTSDPSDATGCDGSSLFRGRPARVGGDVTAAGS